MSQVATRSISLNQLTIRTMVRSAYDAQKLRIQMGNRITANFKTKLGLEQNGMSEKELEKQEKGLLDQLRATYSRITDGIVLERSGASTDDEVEEEQVEVGKLISRRKFKADGIITDYAELALIHQYLRMLANEQEAFKQLKDSLKGIPVYDEFLAKIRGIGAAMAGVIISEIDIFKTKYPSSLWRYAGLDVVYVATYFDDEGKRQIIPHTQMEAIFASGVDELLYKGIYPIKFEGVGTSKKEFCLVQRKYINKDGKQAIRNSISFNPFLKTKLVGVMGPSFLKTTVTTVDGKKMGAARRRQLAEAKGFKVLDSEDSDKVQVQVDSFLIQQGHDVVMDANPYAKAYYQYKFRLENSPKHQDKTAAHLHNMAIRYAVKLFLNDLYNVWRKLEELPVAPTFAEAKLGLTHGQMTAEKEAFYNSGATHTEMETYQAQRARLKELMEVQLEEEVE